MTCTLSLPLVLTIIVAGFPAVWSSAIPPSAYFAWDGASNSSLSTKHDDSRYSMRIHYGHTDLPLIPAYVNAVELMAQYTMKEDSAQVGQRHGVVLPDFPQVEIAVLPNPPRKTIEVHAILWAIYASMVDMSSRKTFKEVEIEIMWSGEIVAYLYFTIPLDEASSVTNQNDAPVLALPTRNDELDILDTANATTTLVSTDIGIFDWNPILKPDGQTISPKDIFILCMGVLKTIAPSPATGKIDGAFHVGSEIVNANLQTYLHGRRTPRTSPPYYQFAHLIEALRRIPGWMLGKKKFAEFYCTILVNNRPVGHILVEKGAFRSSVASSGGNISVS